MNINQLSKQELIEEIKRLQAEKVQSENRMESFFPNNKQFFHYIPVPLIEKNITELSDYLDEIKQNNANEYQLLLKGSVKILRSCFQKSKIININREALKLFKASDKAELTNNISKILTKESVSTFREIIFSILNNNNEYETKTKIKTISGETRFVTLKISIRNNRKTKKAFLTINDITGQIIAEESVKESEKKLRLIANNSIDCIWQMDKKLRFIYLSPSLYQITGFKPEEWIGTPLWKHVKRKEFVKIARKAIKMMWEYKTHNRIIFEAKMLDKENKEFTVEIIGKPLVNENGNLLGLQGSTREISDRITAKKQLNQINEQLKKQNKEYFLLNKELLESLEEIRQINAELEIAKENLEKKENRLIEAQRIAKTGDFTWDVETGELTWSKALLELLGYDTYENIDFTKVNKDIHHPDDVERVNKWLTDCIKSGNKELIPNEYRIIKKNGKPIMVHTSGIIRHRKGRPPVIFATLQDISDRKKLELELIESEKRLKTLMANMPGMAFRCKNNNNWTMLFVSEGAYELTGYKPDDLLNDKLISFSQLIYPEDKQKVWEIVKQNVANSKFYELEYRIITKQKEIKWIWERGFYIDFNNKKNEYIEGFISDITRRMNALQSLKKSELRFRNIFENDAFGIAVSNTEKKFSIVNARFCRMFGYTAPELKTMSFLDLTHPEDVQESKNFSNRLDKSRLKYAKIEKRYLRKNGKTLYGSKTVLQIPGDGSSETYNLAIIEDITAKKQTEAILSESEERFSIIFRISPVPVSLSRMSDAKYTEVNEAWCKLTGYSQEEAVGSTPLELKLIDNNLYNEPSALFSQKGSIINMEITITTADGEKRDVLISLEILSIRGEKFALNMLIDITERNKAREELILHRNQLEDIVAERTKKLEQNNIELIEKNEKLEQLNELFVDREFRIQELKEKIKQLEEIVNALK